MKVMTKRVFSFLLCVVLLAGSNAMQAFCAEIGTGDVDGIVDEGAVFSDEETDEDSLCEDEIEDVYEYSYDEAKLMSNSGDSLPCTFNYESNGEGTCAITGITGPVSGDLIIPETIDGQTVTEIRALGKPNKTLWHGKLYVPATVTTIENQLFDNQYFDEVYIAFSDESNHYFSTTCNTHKVTNIGNGTITLFKIDGNTWNNATTGDRNVTTLGPGETALAEDYEELEYSYEVISESDKTIRLTGYNWLMPSCLTLPEEVDGYKVVALGDTLFRNIIAESYTQTASYLKNVVIPDTVTEISENAFVNCMSLTRVINRSNAAVKLPTVNGHEFRLDSAPDAETSVTVVPAGQTAFRDDSYKLTYEEKEDGSLCITGIDGDARGYLNIPSKVNDKEVTEIAQNAFVSKKSLFGDIILPETITTINGGSFRTCSGFDGELYIPKNLVQEGDTAPFNRIYNISKLTIEEGTTTIYSNEFNGIKCVKELNIPESVTEIKTRGFAGFSSLEGELVIPKNVKYIGDYAFTNITADSVKFEGPVETIEKEAFCGCFNLTEIEFPEGLRTIGEYVVNECVNLETIVIPKTFENKGDNSNSEFALWMDNDMKVKDLINKSLVSIGWIGNPLIEEQSGEELVADKETNMLYPGGRAYHKQWGNRFDYLVVSDKQRTACITGYNREAKGDLVIPVYVDGYVVVGIGSKAFEGCDGFDGELYIPEYIKDIAADAFSDCSNIKRVVNNSTAIVTLPQSSEHSWSDENQGTKNLKTLMPAHVAVREDYDGFKLTYEVISESDKTIRITGYEFERDITGGEPVFNYEIPEKLNGYTVTEIGANAFCGEVMRGFLLIPQTVTSVSEDAFKGCKNLNRIRNRSSVSVKLPLENGYTWNDITDGVSEVYDTEELESKHIACRSDIDATFIANNTTPYYEYSIISEEENTARFYGMPYENYTRTPYIPPTVDGYKVVEIGSRTFSYNDNLKGCLAIPEGVTAVFEFAFYDIKGINALYLPSSLKYIEPRTFSKLGIEHLVIPEGVESIGYFAFGVNPLKTVELPDSLKFCDVSAMRKNGDGVTISEDYSAEVVYPSDCKPYSGYEKALNDALIYAPEGIMYYEFEDDLTNGVYIFQEGIEVVPSDFFYSTSAKELKEVEIPESAKIIGRSAFYGCSNLKRITIPEGVTTIASSAFFESNLTRVDIPASVKSYGQRILKNDGNLKNITFYGSVSVGQYYSYGNVMEIVTNTPNSITNMGDEPLDLLFVLGTDYNSANLVDFEDREKSIGRYLEPGHTAISEKYDGEDFTYEIVSAEDKTVKITGYIGEDTDEIYIPNHILHYHVVDVAEDAFASIENIPKVENAGDAVVTLPVIEGKTWVDAKTGENIKTIKNGQKAVWKELCESGIVYVGLEEGYTYTGSAIKPEITVFDGGVKLEEKTDYTITYKNNTKVYTLKEGDEGFNAKLAPSITITSNGNYSGKETIYFTINPKNISDEDVNVDFAQIFESSKYVAPVPTVTYCGKKLANNKDFTVEYYTNEECNENATPKTAGTYFAKISAKGSNFTGEKTVEFVVLPSTQKAVSKLKISVPKSVAYTGEALEPEVKVSDGKTVLKVGKKGENEQSDCDVYVSFENNTEIGTATVKIEGSGVKYAGSKSVTFKITGTAVKKAKVSGITKTFTYDGTEKKQPSDMVLAYSPKKGVTENLKWIDKADYDLIEEAAEKKNYDAYVTYEKNVNVGTATMVFTGVNKFTGTLKVKYKISAYDITADADGKMSVSTSASYAYSKAGVKPLPKVTFDGETLVNGKDYKLSYSNNNVISALSKKVPTIKITGQGNFKGKMNQSFTIVSKDFASKSVSISVPDKAWSNKAGNWKSTLTVTDDGKKLSAGKDYDKNVRYTYVSIPEGGVIYDGASKDKDKPEITRTKGEQVGDKDIVPAGTVIKVEVKGIGDCYYDGQSVTYRIAARNIGDKKIKVKAEPQIYTGQAIKIAKSDISFSGKNIGEVTYEIDKSSYKNNVNKGKATVVIKGTGNYCGTKTVTFNIKQKIFKWWWED